MRHLFMLQTLLLSLCLLSVQVWGGTGEDAGSDKLRQQFLAAENALKDGRQHAYLHLKQNLVNYPLLPYLEYQEVKTKFSTLTPETFEYHLKKLKNTPLSTKFRNEWLTHLAEQKRWKHYLRYATKGGAVIHQCHRLHAMIQTGQAAKALREVKPIWLSGHSRPKACDPVLKSWIDAGNLTRDLVWQRVEMAMKSRQLRLANYLKRYLPEHEQNRVERWVTLHNRPEQVNSLAQKTHPMRDEMIVHAIRRLAGKDLAASIDAWGKIQADSVFNDKQRLEVIRTLAWYLARKPDDQLSQQLNSLTPTHLRLDPNLSDKRFQIALQQNDWNLVLLTIDNLSAEEKAKERWRYWRARALIQLGKTEEGEKLLESLVKQRSYYGFLAADRLGKSFNFVHQSLSIPASQIEEVANQPGLLRARELKALGRELQARQEWNLALQNSSTEELKGAAKLAQAWDWPSQTILTLAKIHYWNDLELRFPLTHHEQINRQANEHGLDSAWIYAILRQESAFVTDARSSAGAMGLMQLMPGTARMVASKNKHKAFRSTDLFIPQVNIELGASYLNEVYLKLQENPVLATAAYNAGPNRVMTWLPTETQPTDVWIETIPFQETRKYLKRVMAYTLIYSHRMGSTPKSLPEIWLKPIEASSPPS